MFQKLFFCLAMTLAVMLSAEEKFTSGADDAINAMGISFHLAHWDSSWKMTAQSGATLLFPGEAGNFIPGQGNVRTGTFRVKNGDFQLTETQNFSIPGKASVSYELTSPEGIGTNSLALVANLPVKDFRHRPIFFNGKQVNFGSDLNEKSWQAMTDRNAKQTEVILYGRTGKLIITGDFVALLQDNRRYSDIRWQLRLNSRITPGNLKSAKLDVNFTFQPFASTPVDLSAAVNMAFRDETEGDRKGGWTDQGPNNDLAMMPLGKQKFAGLNFDIIDPAANGNRSCIVLRGKDRPYFPESATVKLGGVSDRFLYLLNGIAWEPRTASRIGDVIIRYSDGESKSVPMTSGVNTGNFWMPRPLPEAVIAWRSENDSASVGLYVTRIPLAGKPLESITFKSAGNAVWMIVGATLSNDEITPEVGSQVVMRADSEWRPIGNARPVVPGSVLDFSFLLDKPAGKYGFVKAASDEFQFENRPGKAARFYGANICFTANFMENEWIDRMLDEFAATGYNLIRLHHFDHHLVDRRDGTSTKLAADQMDRLDYLLAGCRKRGIYVTLDLFIYRSLVKGEIPEFPGRAIAFQEFKALVFVNDDAMRNFEEFSANLMNHVNPYTGLAWKNDPVIATVSLLNEDTLSLTYKRHDFIRKIYENKFQEYVRENRLTLTDGNHALLFEKFLQDTYLRGYQRMSRFLRSIGVRTMLTDQNFINTLSLTVQRDRYDFVDNHFYWGHPQFLGRNWSLPASIDTKSAAGACAGGISGMFPSRIIGKPFTITEWDYVNPNPFNVEGAFLTGAYSALQNYSGLCRFAYSHSRDRIVEEASPIRFFDVANDPLRILSERAGTLFFLRGDVKPADVSYPYLLHRDFPDLPNHPTHHPRVLLRLGLIGRTGTLFDLKNAPGNTVAILTAVPEKVDSRYPVVSSLPRSEEMLDQLLEKHLISGQNYDPATQRFTSSTGELEVVGRAKTFRVVTPRSEGFVVPAQTELKGNFAAVSNKTTFAAVLVAAVDELPLAQSKRILILHLTDVKNTGMKFADAEMSVLEDYGTLPQLMRRGEIEITLAARPGMKLYACGFDGARKFEVPVAASKEPGKIQFTARNLTERGAIVAYELVTE